MMAPNLAVKKEAALRALAVAGYLGSLGTHYEMQVPTKKRCCMNKRLIYPMLGSLLVLAKKRRANHAVNTDTHRRRFAPWWSPVTLVRSAA